MDDAKMEDAAKRRSRSARRGLFAALTLLLSAGLLACQPADEAADGEDGETTARSERPAVSAAVDSTRTAFEQAVAEGDFETQAGIYTSDAILSVPGTGVTQGRDSIRALLERTTPPGATLEIRPLESRSLGEDWRYELGTSVLTFTPEGADGEQTAESTYMVLLRQTPDGWKIHREVLSPDAPPPGGQ